MLSQETKIIGICTADINEYYQKQFIIAFNKYADEFDFKILFFNSFSSLRTNSKHDIGESNIFRLINYNILDGLILLSETILSPAMLDEILRNAQSHDVPVISINHYLEGCYNITLNCDLAIEEIVKHMIEVHHCKKINFIAGPKDNIYSEKRIAQYKKELTNHGIPIESERIGYGDFNKCGTIRVMDEFFKSDLPFPDAIVCANDIMAITAYDILVTKGYQIPKDIAITGFDGITEALMHSPSITTAHQNFNGAVKKAYEILQQLFAQKTVDKECFVEPQLILGESCGCNKEHRLDNPNRLARSLYEKIEYNTQFVSNQITMTADLTDNSSFQGIFNNIYTYSENFGSENFWLCIVDNFLTEQEELSDILEENNFYRMGYADKMDIMLGKYDGNWIGFTDFDTYKLLPNLEKILENESNLMFLPLHIHEQNIGYVVLVYPENGLNMVHCYQFLMNISNALEVTKTHMRHQMIIESLENKYVHDPMTGLYNRRGFYQKLDPIYNDCVNNDKPFLVISVDLNGLKKINDTYGHADGDIAISTVAKALTVAIPSLICARFGGDEFITAGKLNSLDDPKQFRTKFTQFLDDFNASSNKPYQVGASVGIVTCHPSANIPLSYFIKEADEKMYEEKVRNHANRTD